MIISLFKTATAISASAMVSISQPADSKHHATPTLITEHLSVVPGTTTQVLVGFKIDASWHLYWDGQNDTGQPPRCTWTLPQGWSISGPVFPAPHRNIQPGGIVDYIYEHQLTLVYALTVPKDTPAQTARISADIEWLECSNVCLFGGAKVEATITVDAKPDAKAKPNPAAKAPLEAVKPLQPKPLSEAKGATVAVTGSSGVINVPEAVRIEYFAGNKSTPPKDSSGGTVSDGSTLTIGFTTKAEPPIVDGIIAVYRTKQGPPVYYSVSTLKPAPAATEPAVPPIK